MRLKHLFVVISAISVFAGCSDEDARKFVASGIVEGTAIKVAAQTGGYILDINFEEGDDVEQGFVIAVIDTEKLVYQSEQVLATLEELEVQHKINLNTLARAKSEYDHIEKKYQRYQDLYEKKSASRQVLDDLKTAFDSGKTQLQNARQNLKLVDSRRKGLEAQAKLLQRQINDASIISPLTGTITTKYYEWGETIPTNAAIAEIINLNKMWTKVYISELLLPKIKVGQEVEVRIDGTDESLLGYVAWISPKAEFTPKNILTEESRTSLVYAVKINVDNPDKLLKHGMPVEVAVKYNSNLNESELSKVE